MANVKFYSGQSVPLEMHKVRIVQKLNLLPIEDRLKKIQEAGNNTFLLMNKDVYLDMLTDSGVNAMSDRQLASMMEADDSYAGSATYTKLENKIRELFHKEYFLPAHQGRACESILSEVLVTPGTIVPMNYHFTTTRAHIVLRGGSVEEIITPKGLDITSAEPFKGDMDLVQLENLIATHGADKIAFVRIEAGTNLIGGQPVSMENMKAVSKICRKHGIISIMDASLLADNLYFIKEREASCAKMSIREINKILADQFDILYFSARKLGHARGGGIMTNSKELYLKMRELITLFEGFLTYGGMSVREIEALAVGLEETMDEDMISQGPLFTKYMVDKLAAAGVPVVTPAGGLGCHIDAIAFLDHVPREEYRAGALASALYIASGIRGMERGTVSEDRNPDGSDHLANMELLRLALPRRVFTMSQVDYAVDRVIWLYENRHLIGGLRFVEEPKILRFFFGKLEATSDWQKKLTAKFRKDFGDSL